MTWLIIVLVFAAVLGPVMWLRPSPKDKRLSALRKAARGAGLQVDIKFFPKLNPSAEDRVSAGGRKRDTKVQVAAYELIFGKPLREVQGWRVLHQAGNGSATRPTIEVSPNWVFDPSQEYPPGGGWPGSWEVVRIELEPLQAMFGADQQFLGVELQARQIGVYWPEKPGATTAMVDQMAACLGKIESRLAALDQSVISKEQEEIP